MKHSKNSGNNLQSGYQILLPVSDLRWAFGGIQYPRGEHSKNWLHFVSWQMARQPEFFQDNGHSTVRRKCWRSEIKNWLFATAITGKVRPERQPWFYPVLHQRAGRSGEKWFAKFSLLFLFRIVWERFCSTFIFQIFKIIFAQPFRRSCHRILKVSLVL